MPPNRTHGVLIPLRTQEAKVISISRRAEAEASAAVPDPDPDPDPVERGPSCTRPDCSERAVWQMLVTLRSPDAVIDSWAVTTQGRLCWNHRATLVAFFRTPRGRMALELQLAARGLDPAASGRTKVSFVPVH